MTILLIFIASHASLGIRCDDIPKLYLHLELHIVGEISKQVTSMSESKTLAKYHNNGQ